MKIITGSTGQNHITANDDGALHASIFGEGCYVLAASGRFTCTVVDNTTVQIGPGEGLMYGRHFRTPKGSVDTLTIQAGVTGYNRCDIIAAHYKNTGGVESIGLAVLSGSSTTGTSSANRLEGMILNTIYGIITAKACGIQEPTVGILNVDGARACETALRQLQQAGYPIRFAESVRADGGAVMRGNDVLQGTPDVMVCDSLTGNVLIKNVTPKHLEPITAKLELAGATVEEFDDAVRVYRTGDLMPLKIKTMPHPGFPTDMQPLMGVLLSVAHGTSIITEGIWENRFRYVDELRRMGANIRVLERTAIVEGVPQLRGTRITATDLRAGAALVLAGIVAEGETRVHNIKHIDRGYEDYCGKLEQLGANVTRRRLGASRE